MKQNAPHDATQECRVCHARRDQHADDGSCYTVGPEKFTPYLDGTRAAEQKLSVERLMYPLAAAFTCLAEGLLIGQYLLVDGLAFGVWIGAGMGCLFVPFAYLIACTTIRGES